MLNIVALSRFPAIPRVIVPNEPSRGRWMAIKVRPLVETLTSALAQMRGKTRTIKTKGLLQVVHRRAKLCFLQPKQLSPVADDGLLVAVPFGVISMCVVNRVILGRARNEAE